MYGAALTKLRGLQPGTMGIGTVQALTKALGVPRIVPAVHIAGTNGKGSVAVKVAAALQAQGLRVGAYTSPHVSSIRERVCVNGEMISESELQRGVDRILETAAEAKVSPSCFEVMTCLALEHFEKKEVDYCVIEAGMGGRDDATNVIVPILSVITTVGLDHMHVLGRTVEEIATNKAGIIKRGVPLVIGPDTPVSLLFDLAFKLESSCVVCDEAKGKDPETYNTLLAGRIVHMLSRIDKFSLDQHKLLEALQTRAPCRFQEVRFDDRTVILDVAHNPAALRAAKRMLDTRDDNELHVVASLYRDKQIHECLSVVASFQGLKSITFVATPHERSSDPKELQKLADKVMGSSVQVSIADSVQEAAVSRGTVLITGSFALMQEARVWLGLVSPDAFDSQEGALMNENAVAL